MPDPSLPGDPPPDLPPEYAEAYRRGYERAFRGVTDDEDWEPIESPLGEAFEAAQARDAVWVRREPRDRPPWLAPALLGALALILLLSAYGLGKAFSHSVADADVSAPKSTGQLIPSILGGSTERPDTHAPTGKKYDGPTKVAPIAGASASCTAPKGVDAGGHQVSYTANKVYDGDMSTAWRCYGSGVGQALTIDLPSKTQIGEVGLIPGYAKTDPRSGADRYAQNNRITRVRWTFSDGASLDQRFDTSPKRRDMQSIRIPKTTADRVVLDILSSARGPRNTVAVSEVRLGAIPDSAGKR